MPTLRRARQDGRQADAAEIARVFDLLRADNDEPGCRIDDAGRAVLTTLERSRNDQWLEARARLKDVSDGAIAIALGSELRAIVRVVGWLIDHRQYFARLYIEDDDRARTRVVGFDRRFERAIGEVLQPQIDTRAQVLAVMRRPNARNIFDGAAETILEHPLGT